MLAAILNVKVYNGQIMAYFYKEVASLHHFEKIFRT